MSKKILQTLDHVLEGPPALIFKTGIFKNFLKMRNTGLQAFPSLPPPPGQIPSRRCLSVTKAMLMAAAARGRLC